MIIYDGEIENKMVIKSVKISSYKEIPFLDCEEFIKYLVEEGYSVNFNTNRDGSKIDAEKIEEGV